MIAGSGGVATLIVNPAAGRAPLLQAKLPEFERLLAQHSLSLRVLTTSPEPGSAAALAASAQDSELVLACGGDGTVHGVVQGLAHSPVALGIVPLGTANALARNLRIPLEPLAAVRELLQRQPNRVALGRVETATDLRYFVLMAGCGPDGALVHTLPAATKAGLGRAAYYAHALRLVATRRFPSFQVRYRAPGTDRWHETEAAALMAARVPDLGGLFSGLTRTSPLLGETLHLHLLRAPAAVSFAAWFGLSRLRLPNPWLATVEADAVECLPLTRAPVITPVYAQADAEPLGALPLQLGIVPAALNLLLPPVQPRVLSSGLPASARRKSSQVTAK